MPGEDHALARPGLHRPQRAGLAAEWREFRAIDPAEVLDGPPAPSTAPLRCRSQAAENGIRVRPARLAWLGPVPSHFGEARDQYSVRTRYRGAKKSRERLDGPLAPCAVLDARCSRRPFALRLLRGRGEE